MDAIIADFDERITPLEREIARLLKEGAWAESAALLRTIRDDYETPPVLALVPLGMLCVIVLWLDRHIVIKPRRTSSHHATMAYRVLLGWGVIIVLLFLRIFTYGY